MKILLISPNTLRVPYPIYPIGLDYVAGAVSDLHPVRIADMNTMDRQELASLMEEFTPDIIGLSCRNIDNTEAGGSLSFISQFRELVDWLRDCSKAVIVCGGSGFTIMPAETMDVLGCDYGIIGEGERFRLLVEALEQGRDASQLPGVVSSCRPAAMPPPWDGAMKRGFDSSFSHHRFYLERGGMLNLQTKRGCPYRCIYCPYPHIEGKKHRLIPPDQVAGDALRLQEAGAKYLFITDSIFNSDVRHSLDVARAFIMAGLTIPWGGFFAPVKLPDDYFRVMREAGLRHVEFGTESLAAAMLKSYRKPFGVQDVFAAHAQARQARLHVAHYFLLGGPGETRHTVEESLDNIEQLERTALFFFIGIRIYPGTELYEIAVREGKIPGNTSMLEPVFYQPDNIDLATIGAMVSPRAEGRSNWITGSGGTGSAEEMSRMHERGRIGPLWEYLIR